MKKKIGKSKIIQDQTAGPFTAYSYPVTISPPEVIEITANDNDLTHEFSLASYATDIDGDTVKIEDADFKNGTYVVRDSMNRRAKMKIDFLESIGSPKYKLRNVSLIQIKS